MPISIRKQAKRALDACRTHAAWIHYHLDWCNRQYAEQHPEWAKRFELADELNKTLDALIDALNREL